MLKGSEANLWIRQLGAGLGLRQLDLEACAEGEEGGTPYASVDQGVLRLICVNIGSLLSP